MIFKTFDSDIDKWTAKVGIFGKSFNDLGVAIDNAFDNLFDNGEDFWESLKNNLFPKKEDIQSQILDVDKLYPEIDKTKIKDITNEIKDMSISVANGNKTWQEYFDELPKGKKHLAEIGQQLDGQIITTDKVAEANQNARQAVIAHNKELEQQTLKAKASQLVMGLLSTAMNALVSIIITKVIQGFVDMANAQENAIKKADEFINKFEEMRNELSSNKKTIDDISADYERLSKGVDALGRNVSLNTEEYSEYNDIVNQIADMFPQMISGYTEEGNAIIAHKGNVEALTKAYEEQKKAAQDAIIVGSADVFKGYKSKIDYKAGWIWEENGLLQMKKYAEELSAIIDDTEAVAVFWENQRNNRNGGNNLLQKDFLDYANIDVGHHTSEYDYVKILQENKPKILSAIRQLTTEINTETAKIKPIMSAFMEQSWDYQTLDSDVQDVVKQIVNQFDSEFYAQFNNENEMASWITDNIVDKFKGVEGEKLSSEIELMFGVQTQFNNNEITVSEYQSKLSAFLALIEPLDDETEKAIKLLFDIEVDENGNSNSTTSTLIKNVENKLKDEFDGKVGELTLGDLQIAANNISVPDGVNLTWDDLLARIEAFKTASQKTTLTDLITQSKELQNSFDDTFSNQSTIQSAFDKIQEGTSLTADEVRELKTLCPQLNNAFEQVADGWTISSEDLVNANENITRSAKTSIENQIELLKQIKKPTSVNSKSDWEQYDSWRQAQQEIAGLELVLSMFGLTAKETSKNFSDMADEVSSKTKLMSTAMGEMRDTGHISASTYSEIVEMGGNFAECLEIQNGQLVLNVQKLKELETQEYKNKISENQLTIAMLQREAATRAMSNGDWQSISAMITELQKENEFNQLLIDEINNAKPDNKTDTTDSSDPIKAAFDAENEKRKFWVEMGKDDQGKKYTEDMYYAWLDSAEGYKHYFSDLTKYLDENRQYEAEIYKWKTEQDKKLHDQRISNLEELADKSLDGDLPEEVDYTNPLNKFDVARGYINDAITECQNRLQELIESGSGNVQDEIDELNDTIDSLRGKLKDLGDEEFEVKISTWEENNNYNENDVVSRNNRSNYVKSLIAETYGENSEEYQKFMKENAEFDEETYKLRVENEETYWKNVEQQINEKYDKELERLKEIADEEERITKENELQNNLIKARQQLENAKKNRNQMIITENGIEYVENQEDVLNAIEAVNDAQQAIDEDKRNQEEEQVEKDRQEELKPVLKNIKAVEIYSDKVEGNVAPENSDSEILDDAKAYANTKNTPTDTTQEINVETSEPVVVEQTGQSASDNTGIQGTKQLYTIDEAAKILADRLGVSIDSDAWKNFATSVVSNGNPQSSPLSGIQNQNVYNNSTVNNDNSQTIVVQQANFNLDKGSGEEVIYQAFNNLKNRFASYDDRRRGK